MWVKHNRILFQNLYVQNLYAKDRTTKTIETETIRPITDGGFKCGDTTKKWKEAVTKDITSIEGYLVDNTRVINGDAQIREQDLHIRELKFIDDFIGALNSNIWRTTTVGATISELLEAPTGIRISTGATTDNYAYLHTGTTHNNTDRRFVDCSKNPIFSTRMRVSSTTNIYTVFGVRYFDGTTHNIWISYNTKSSTYLETITQKANAVTKTITTFTISPNTWYYLVIEATTSYVTFKAGTTYTNLTTLATHTTNIPTVILGLVLLGKTFENVNKNIDFDFYHLYSKR